LFADSLSSVKPSPSIAARARVDALRAQGREIIDFTIGEPDFDTPSHIVEGGIQALRDGHTRYTATSGIPALKNAITLKLKRENHLVFSAEEVIVGCGAKHVIYNALAATLNEGDEVIVPAPYWVSYPDMVSLHRGKPVIVMCSPDNGFKLDGATLRAAITPRTRWIILNTPNNPTGAVYTREELEALSAVLNENPHVWILTDEIYEHFVYGNARHLSLLSVAPELKNRILVVNGLSKSYAFTGWRIGYGVGPIELIKRIHLLLTQSTTCAAAMSQAAAVIALEGQQDCVKSATYMFEARRDRMVELLREVPGISCQKPDGAFYVFLSVAGLIGQKTPGGLIMQTDVDVMNYFIEHAGVATIDGSSYGAPSYLRMSFATPMKQIEAGCLALAAAAARCVSSSAADGDKKLS
jgi:aspartate aminotransferase